MAGQLGQPMTEALKWKKPKLRPKARLVRWRQYSQRARDRISLRSAQFAMQVHRAKSRYQAKLRGLIPILRVLLRKPELPELLQPPAWALVWLRSSAATLPGETRRPVTT